MRYKPNDVSECLDRNETINFMPTIAARKETIKPVARRVRLLLKEITE